MGTAIPTRVRIFRTDQLNTCSVCIYSSPSPVEPRCEYTRYRHGDSTYLFFVWITDNVDEKGIACAENVEYLEETAGYLGGVVNGEPIWIRSR